MLSQYVSLLRIPHYIKNLYLFLPVFFGGQLLNTADLISTSIAFISFCLASSAVYILNDIKDVEFDRLHPVKKLRPVAAGTVSITACYTILALLLIASFAVAYTISLVVLGIVAGYFVLNVFYCLGLKNIAIVDITIISIGFLLRVLAGGAASHIIVSKWLIIMVFLLSMFQALSKRMDDLILMANNRYQVTRKSISGYSIEFLQIAVSMLSGVLLVCYLMYIVQPEITQRMGEFAYGTTFFVLLGLLRYLQLTFVRNAASSPVKILTNDKFIQACVVCWIIAFGVLLYVN